MSEPPAGTTEYGVARGKVFPASKARSLLNPLRRIIQSPERTAARVGTAPDARVLEIGCGPGYFSPALAASVTPGRLVVADLQREMLDLATTRLDSKGLRADPVQADATRLPLRSAAFDVVVVILMLGEIPDRDACIHEVRRVLRDGGIAFFAETRRDSDFIRFDDLSALVRPHGFDVLDRRGPSWEYTARFVAH
jgi:ubiquinone/menaquinone biosynthesis C-methylase UbiE